MAWRTNLLVVANVTATSDELVAALKARATRGPIACALIVPATPFGGGRAAAASKLEQALTQLREAGLHAEGSVGNPDPLVAVSEAWDPKAYDEIVVSTLPMRLSKWLHAGLPERVANLTGAPVTHVVAQPPRPAPPTAPPRSRDGAGDVMGPLKVLAWGKKEH